MTNFAHFFRFLLNILLSLKKLVPFFQLDTENFVVKLNNFVSSRYSIKGCINELNYSFFLQWIWHQNDKNYTIFFLILKYTFLFFYLLRQLATDFLLFSFIIDYISHIYLLVKFTGYISFVNGNENLLGYSK